MNEILDENAQMNVEISNLRATDEELDKLKGLIVQGLSNNGTAPTITSVSNDSKGSHYTLQFKVLNPRHFLLSTVQDWLYAATLVDWRIDATFVHRQQYKL